MFWSKQKKAEKAVRKKEEQTQKLREDALANMRTARDHIGEETVRKLAEIMERKQNSAMERAKADIAAADPDRVLDELKWMLDQRE